MLFADSFNQFDFDLADPSAGNWWPAILASDANWDLVSASSDGWKIVGTAASGFEGYVLTFTPADAFTGGADGGFPAGAVDGITIQQPDGDEVADLYNAPAGLDLAAIAAHPESLLSDGVSWYGYSAAGDTLYGTDIADNLGASGGDSTLLGGGGDDVLQSGRGGDLVSGGDGYDTVRFAVDSGTGVTVDLSIEGAQDTHAGIDTLVSVEGAMGGDGDDTLTGSAGANGLHGASGDDILAGLGGADTLTGYDGADSLDGGAGADNLNGGVGADLLLGGADNDTLAGSWGHDRLYGGGGDDLIYGVQIGALSPDAGDALFGEDGDDRLIGDQGDDRLLGGSGDDVLKGGLGTNVLNGGKGLDVVDYSDLTSGIDGRLQGQGARQIADGVLDSWISIEGITGTVLADRLEGEKHANLFDGGGGDDTLIGGKGADTLTGGLGADRFVYTRISDSRGKAVDHIVDLTGADVIDLSTIDADVKAAGDQAFHLVSHFSGVRGELILVTAHHQTTVEGDVNGDGEADFAIHLDGDLRFFTNFVL